MPRLLPPTLLITSALAAPLLVACAEVPSAGSSEVVAPADGDAVVAAAPLATAKEVRPPVEIVRDPFESYLSLSTVSMDELRQTRLERIPLDRLRLVGVVQQTAPLALLQDGSGEGFTVRIGTNVGTDRGRVTAIGATGVTIEERFRDPLGRYIKVEKQLALVPQRG